MRRAFSTILVALVLVLVAGGAALAQQRPNRVYLPAVARPEPLVNATPPAPADAVQVRSVVVRRPSSGSLYLEGEIINPSPAPIFFTEITARFFDAGGQLVATDESFTFLTETAPGQRNPFRLILSNPPATIASYTLSLSGSPSSSLAYRTAEVLNQQTRDNFGLEVFGDVRNPEALQLNGVEVAATFYDAAGNVVTVEDGFATPLNLAPGATGAYRLPTFDAFSYATFTVRAQGYLAP